MTDVAQAAKATVGEEFTVSAAQTQSKQGTAMNMTTGTGCVDSVAAVDQAIRTRRSTRAFRQEGLDIRVVMEILEVAARAPSGHNTQPWQVHVVCGAGMKRLSSAILAAFDAAAPGQYVPEFDAYPPEWVSPYIDRRRTVGKDMYTLLNVPRGDRDGMRRQSRRNYEFFDAPVGLLFTLRRVMVPGSVLDLGIFLQSVMLAARARGVDTCTQAAFANFHQVIKTQLEIEDDEVLICGMAMGWADQSAPVNAVVTAREAALAFTRLHTV